MQTVSPTTLGERIAGLALLAFTSIFIIWGFYPELETGEIQYSDVTFHLAILRQLDDAVRSGGSVFDFWFDASPFGYALFRSYQHLPHLIMYLSYRLCAGLFSLPTILTCFTIFFAALMPWVFFLSARVLGLSWWQALCTGLLSPLLSEAGDFGLSLRNYSWGTHGIIMQLWAVIFLVPAVAWSTVAIRDRKGLAPFLAFSFLAVGSHIIAAYIIVASLILASVCSQLSGAKTRAITLKNGAWAFSGFMAVTAHQWVFIFLDRSLIHRSLWEPEWKFSGRGIAWTMSQLFSGALFDRERLPVVTACVFLGIALSVSQLRVQSDSWLNSTMNFVLLSFFLWLSLLCGYEVWGLLFSQIPLLSSMHLHRFIVPTQIFGLFLAGFSLGRFLHWVPARSLRLILLTIFLSTPWNTLLSAFNKSQDLIDRSQTTAIASTQLEQLFSEIATLPRSWLHLGMSANWADTLKIAGITPLYHLSVAKGYPTLGMLFHSMGLAGDVLFDFKPEREQAYSVFGVRYTVSPLNQELPPFLKPRLTVGPFRLSEYENAHLISVEDLAFQGWGNSIDTVHYLKAWVQSSLPSSHAYGLIVQRTLLDSLFSIPFASRSLNVPIAPTSPGRLISESTWNSKRISAVVEATRDAIVVFRTGYHPNWRATIDGVAQPVMQVTPGFLAVRVSAGQHQVYFEYKPSAAKPWLFCLSVLSILMMLRFKHLT